jgi:hypothetical protein
MPILFELTERIVKLNLTDYVFNSNSFDYFQFAYVKSHSS